MSTFKSKMRRLLKKRLSHSIAWKFPSYRQRKRHFHKRKIRKSSSSAVKLVSKTDEEWLNRELPNAWNMTSKDYYTDPDVRLSDIYTQLHDDVAMTTFRTAILENRHLFIKRKILIIGCSMLTLPLWAAKAGAEKIFVVDSSHAIEYLRIVVATQNLCHIIKLFHSNIEEVELPTTKVDVILSNWMGFSLLGDSKCYDVIYARNKWLNKRTGIIFPDKAELHLAGIECAGKKQDHIDWWYNVYDFNMQAMRLRALKAAVHMKIRKSELMTIPTKIWEIDLEKAEFENLQVLKTSSLKPMRNGIMDGLVTYFNINFSKAHKRIGFTTSPGSSMTNWMQTVFYFNNPIEVKLNYTLDCNFTMRSVKGFENFENIEVNTKIMLDAKQLISKKWMLSQLLTYCDAEVQSEQEIE